MPVWGDSLKMCVQVGTRMKVGSGPDLQIWKILTIPLVFQASFSVLFIRHFLYLVNCYNKIRVHFLLFLICFLFKCISYFKSSPAEVYFYPNHLYLQSSLSYSDLRCVILWSLNFKSFLNQSQQRGIFGLNLMCKDHYYLVSNLLSILSILKRSLREKFCSVSVNAYKSLASRMSDLNYG